MTVATRDRCVDPIAVEKAAAGYRVKVRSIELRAAVQILTRRGSVEVSAFG